MSVVTVSLDDECLCYGDIRCIPTRIQFSQKE